MTTINAFCLKLIKTSRYLKNNGFLTATNGNISVRINKDRFIITPKGKDKGQLKKSDLIVMNVFGDKIYGKYQPSGEWMVHAMIYMRRSDIKAVIHTHPVYTTALSLTNFDINKPVLPEIIVDIGKIALVGYAKFYTKELVYNLQRYVKNHNTFILRNHGLITIGRSLEEALFRTEKVEYLCKVLFIANSFGEVNILSKTQVTKLLELNRID